MEFNPETNAIIRRLSQVDVGVAKINRPRVEAAINEHLRALSLPARPIRWADDARSGIDAAWDAARAAAWDAARDAAWAAAWDAAWDADLKRPPAVERALGIRLPFVDAFEAGLWLYWVTPREVIAVPRPALRVKGEHLHCEDGPAVFWPTGERYYFLNGVRVTSEIVETPSSLLDPKLITRTSNAEQRREVVRKVGIERVCSELNAKVLDRDPDYELLALDLGDGRQRPYLKMKNPSIGVFHIEGVSPECRTVQEALNFRNGLTPDLIDDENGADWLQQGDVIIRPHGPVRFKSRPLVLT